MRSSTKADVNKLRQEIAFAQDMADRHAGDWLMATQWKNRVSELNIRLTDMPQGNFPPVLRLLFGGKSVIGSRAIEAQFASEAIGHIVAVIKSEYAVESGTQLASRGKPRNESESEMFITGTPRGSFGFELTGPDPTDLYMATNLEKVIENVATVISKATTSDEEFLNALDLLEQPRTYNRFGDFFKVLSEHNSTLKVETRDNHLEISEARILEARLRFQETRQSEEEVTMEGKYLGGFLERYRFAIHFNDSDNGIEGSIDHSVTDDQIAEWNKQFSGIQIVATLKETTLIDKSGKQKIKYRLLDLKNAG